MQLKKISIVVCFSFSIIIMSCSSGKNITNKVFLNDNEMALSLKKVEKSENSFLLYREGVSGANGGKSGGGCGCN